MLSTSKEAAPDSKAACPAGLAYPWLPLLAMVAILVYVYWPTLAEIAHRWSRDSQYSHGYLVPAFALVLLRLRRPMLNAIKPEPNWWGLGILLFGVLVHFTATQVYFGWAEAVSLLICLAGAVLLLGGWPLLRWAWPTIAFLVFMIPLPFFVETALAQPLQRIATESSTYVLQTLGFPAYSVGNTIQMRQAKVNVVDACNGLSMLILFFALSTAVAMLCQRPLLDRMVIVLSTIPIALASNILRISGTAILFDLVDPSVLDRVVPLGGGLWSPPKTIKAAIHDWGGLLMMPIALGLLWLELWLISCILKDTGPARALTLELPGKPGSPRNAPKPEKRLPPKVMFPPSRN